MARTTIRSGQTITTELDLASGDRLYIEQGGAVSRSGAVPAVRVTGAEAFVRNEGTIAVSGASGAALTGALSGTLDVTVVNDGTISGSAGAIAFSSASGTTGAFTLVNTGTISGGTSQAVTLKDLRASTITIVNREGGSIENSGSADVLRPGHDLAAAIRVVNEGDIVAGSTPGASSNGDGIDFQPQDGGVAATVVNRATGHIEGGKHGITGANAAFILNEAGGEIVGRNGSGINYDTEAADGDAAVRVVNHGLISGRFDGVTTGDGDGVDVDYLVDIRNDGTIEGVGADNVDNFADGVAAGGGSIVNLSGGSISGDANGILIDDGDRNGAYAATGIVNAGTISANTGYAIRLIGDFDDTIVNTGLIYTNASTVAAIDAGAGDDRVVNRGAIIGTVDLGAGADTYQGATGGGLFNGITVDGGAGDDRIVTGSDSDVLIGGLGADRLTGGAGSDVFVFDTVADSSAVRADADRILDFASGDTIDLSAIDADTTIAGDQSFAYAGASAFSGTPGELIAAAGANGFVVSGDVDGDGAADFSIVLVGVTDPALLAFAL